MEAMEAMEAMDGIIDALQKTHVFCGITNFTTMDESRLMTGTIIKNILDNLSPCKPLFDKPNNSDAYKHLVQCNYRYIDYIKRGIFYSHDFDYIDRALVIFGQKFPMEHEATSDQMLLLLFMVKYIDDEIYTLL